MAIWSDKISNQTITQDVLDKVETLVPQNKLFFFFFISRINNSEKLLISITHCRTVSWQETKIQARRGHRLRSSSVAWDMQGKMKRWKEQAERKIEIPFGALINDREFSLVKNKRLPDSIRRIYRNRASLDSQISTGIARWTNPSPRSCYPSWSNVSTVILRDRHVLIQNVRRLCLFFRV